MSDYPETPELDKQTEVIMSGKTVVIQDFIDWLLDEKQFVIAEWGEPNDNSVEDQELFPTYLGREDLMAAFFGIDLKTVEAERRAILEHIREEAG